jgi:acyl carrier protein
MLAAHLRAVPPDVDWASITLPELGLDSMSAIELVLAIEEVLEVRFPEPLLVRETFVTLASLESAVRSLVDSP